MSVLYPAPTITPVQDPPYIPSEDLLTPFCNVPVPMPTTGKMNGKTSESKEVTPVDNVKMKNGNGTIPNNNNDTVLVVTAKIKEDFLVDAKQGPESGVFSKLKSNLVDVIVCNAVGPHNFCVSLSV